MTEKEVESACLHVIGWRWKSKARAALKTFFGSAAAPSSGSAPEDVRNQADPAREDSGPAPASGSSRPTPTPAPRPMCRPPNSLAHANPSGWIRVQDALGIAHQVVHQCEATVGVLGNDGDRPAQSKWTPPSPRGPAAALLRSILWHICCAHSKTGPRTRIRVARLILPLPRDTMRYKIVLQASDEGYSVSCPALPGCWSQGTTEKEAIENIEDAIREYLAVLEESLQGADVREIEVQV